MKIRLAFFLLSLALAGCGAQKKTVLAPQFLPRPEVAEPAESVVLPPSLPSTHVPERSDPNVRLVQELMDRASQLFDSGESLLRQGEIGEGKRQLRRSIDLIRNSPFSMFEYPQLGSFYGNLQRDAAALEAAFAEEQDTAAASVEDRSDQTLEPAVVDVLPSINLRQITVDPSLISIASDDVRTTPFEIPIPLNDRVFRMLEYYESRSREIMGRGLTESGRYLPLFRRIFQEEGVPRELIHLAQVESLYRPLAYSRARAKGIWQFTRSTARDYLLRLNRWIDERSDIEKSTRAAARYLKELYVKFGDWHIALAAYNWGPGRLERVQARRGNISYWEMVDSGLVPAETANYVPSVLATIIIASHPQRYGFQVDYARPLEFEKVNMGRSVRLTDIAEVLGIELEALKELNPELTRMVTPADYPEYQLKVPQGTAAALADQIALVPDARSGGRRYRVKLGDTLAGLARKFGVAVGALAQANKLSAKSPLIQDVVLVIPAPDRSVTRSGRPEAGSSVYRIRRGDTLSAIARTFGTSVSALTALNDLDPDAQLHIGQILILQPGKTPKQASSTGVSKTNAGGAHRIVHSVRKGETVGSIARRYGTDVQSIRKWNPSVATLIRPGQQLTILVSD